MTSCDLCIYHLSILKHELASCIAVPGRSASNDTEVYSLILEWHSKSIHWYWECCLSSPQHDTIVIWLLVWSPPTVIHGNVPAAATVASFSEHSYLSRIMTVCTWLNCWLPMTLTFMLWLADGQRTTGWVTIRLISLATLASAPIIPCTVLGAGVWLLMKGKLPVIQWLYNLSFLPWYMV